MVAALCSTQPIPQIEPRDFKVRGVMTYAGIGGNPRRLSVRRPAHLARVALAYRVNPRTVNADRYGIFFDIARQNVNQAGDHRQTTLSASPDSGRTFVTFPTKTRSRTASCGPLGNTLGLMTNVGQTINTVNVRLLNPYTQRWRRQDAALGAKGCSRRPTWATAARACASAAACWTPCPRNT